MADSDKKYLKVVTSVTPAVKAKIFIPDENLELS